MGLEEEDILEIDLDENELNSHENFWYELWILGSDKDQNATDYSKFIFKTTDIEEAIEKAEDIYDDPSEIVKELPNQVKFITIQVETVVERKDDNPIIPGEIYTEAVDHVYNRIIEIEK